MFRVGQYVHAFALAGEPRAAADIALSELSYLQRGEREYDYRHRQGASFVDRTDRFLDTVERCVLPVDREAAVQLLKAFIASEESISASCHDDDFGASEVFRRARRLVEAAA